MAVAVSTHVPMLFRLGLFCIPHSTIFFVLLIVRGVEIPSNYIGIETQESVGGLGVSIHGRCHCDKTLPKQSSPNIPGLISAALASN